MQVIGNRNLMDLDFCLLLFTSLFIRASIYAPQILQQLLVVHCMLYQRNKDQSWWNRENNLLCTAFSCQWLQWELSRCFLDKGCFLLQRSSSKIHSVFLQDSAHHDSAIPVNLNSWRIKKMFHCIIWNLSRWFSFITVIKFYSGMVYISRMHNGFLCGLGFIPWMRKGLYCDKVIKPYWLDPLP